jgi:hypothetical protein
LAIVQISQISNRKGLAVNLPQLVGGELGWSVDTRQLWIGNGTLEEGAPVIGNTEILTQFSDILAFTNTYTYKGQAAGYVTQTGATAGTPVTNSLQSWLDQWASVLDFGAVGDGVTDDTDAINRALYQLYCREVNPQIRRSLFFPAGVYRVTGSINIPPYATLYGEGNNNSVIAMDVGVNYYVARTADNLQQTGVNIGDAGATPPESITITNMGFTHLDPTGSVFLVEDANDIIFQNVGFRGASTTTDLTSDANGSIGVSFASTNALVCESISFSDCVFSGLTWASYTDKQVKGATFSQSKLDTLYSGFEFGTGAIVNGGPTGVRIVSNLFDNIYSEGIIFGDISLNASGYNIFYDVGNHFEGVGNPYTSIIDIQSNTNISISDMFQRSDADAATVVRINLNNTASIATTNGEQLSQGTYTRLSGSQFALINDSTGSITNFSTNLAKAFKVDYTIVRTNYYRTGTLFVASNTGSGSPVTSDTGAQNHDTGITLSVSQVGSTCSLDYSASDIGADGTIYYSITYLA